MGKGRAVLERSALGRDAIVEAGLAILDRAGFAGCTCHAVADHLCVTPEDIAAHFASRNELLSAISEAMLGASGDEDLELGWRAHVQQRGTRYRQAMLSRRDGPLVFAHVAAQRPRIEDVMTAAVDHFTLGYCLTEQVGGSLVSQGDFHEQLNLLLSAADVGTRGDGHPDEGEWQSRFQARLWSFLRDARESANISFARTTQLNELDRRILLLIQAQGGMTLAAISMACGVDKAQVSRAIKRMDESDLLSRDGIRSPIQLSANGRQLADLLLRRADVRNRELTFGVSDEELQTLSVVLDTLLSRAIMLFEQERKQAAAHHRQEPVDFQDLVDEGLPGENGVAVVRSRILPPFVTLCSYVLRGGALAHKRQTGLSNFESWVMSEICRNPPISWPQLVVALSRDQSQAGRTVNHLIDIGLIERSGRPGRRHGFFAPTRKGLEMSEIIESTAIRRSEFLFQGIPETQLKAFRTAFETLAHNAEVQLAREKAIQELDRS